jgi:hypothetical protein
MNGLPWISSCYIKYVCTNKCNDKEERRGGERGREQRVLADWWFLFLTGSYWNYKALKGGCGEKE